MGLTLRFNDPALEAPIKALLGAMAVAEIPAGVLHQDRRIHGSNGGPFHIDASGDLTEYHSPDLNGLLYAIEKPFIMAAQRQAGRKALYLHAAVVQVEGKTIAIAGPSCGGKSTLAHYAVTQGHTLLSDELAPINLTALTVQPYPRGIRLRVPATPPALALGPSLAIYTWPGDIPHKPQKLDALYLLSGQERPQLCTPILSPAEALLALYPSTLNSLAHDRAGLDALQKIVTQVPVFTLNRGPLNEMLTAITR